MYPVFHTTHKLTGIPSRMVYGQKTESLHPLISHTKLKKGRSKPGGREQGMAEKYEILKYVRTPLTAAWDQLNDCILI